LINIDGPEQRTELNALKQLLEWKQRNDFTEKKSITTLYYLNKSWFWLCNL